jgi:ABC-type antimicrobial peptide transport system permease subunit
MKDIVAESIARQRANMLLMSVFGGIALLLAAIGVYGLVAYSVRERTREIGIRMALGSSQSNVLGLVARHGITLVAIGIAIGLAAAFGLTRSIQSLIFGIAPNDPLTFATVALVLSTVALIACGVPAWRAARIDPILALRQE